MKNYDTIAAADRVNYFGTNKYIASTDQKYKPFAIAPIANKKRFIEYLILHQNGQTAYYTFCQHAAQSGLAKWRVDITEMT